MKKENVSVINRPQRTGIENKPLSWGEAVLLFGADLPALAERINELTKDK